MSDLLREIEHEVRRDRLIRLWQRYWKRIVAGAAVVVLVAGGVAAWREYRESQRQVWAQHFAAALADLRAGQAEAAAQDFRALGEEASAGYAAMAQLREAEALIRSGDRTGAVAVYDRLAADARVDRVYRDLAALFAAQLLLDTAPREEIDRRLERVAVDGNPWRFLAREIMALAAFRAGELEEARETFAALAEEPGVSLRTQARANEMLAILGRREEPGP